MDGFRGHNRRKPNQLISTNQKRDLLTYIAGAGETWDVYAEFCTRFKIPMFTKYYFKTWCQRNRTALQELRKGHIEAVAKMARMTREYRIKSLEADIERIELILVKQNDESEELTTDQLIKFMEQKRKHFEALAKERNEWGRESEEDDRSGPKVNILDDLGDRARKLLDAAPIEPAVEAEFTVMEEEPNDA